MKHVSFRRFAFAVMAASGIAAGALIPQDPDAKQLAVERHEAAQLVWEHLPKSWETAADCDTRALWSRRLAEAAAESGAVPAREAFAQHLARMQVMMLVIKDRQEVGRSSDADVAVVQFHVAEARSLAKR